MNAQPDTSHLTPGTSGLPARISLRVLVVDDDPHFGRFIQDIFDGIPDCELTIVRDGTAAKARLQDEKFDLVFLDLKMPPPDGREVLAYIRATTPELPVLILSGVEHADDELTLDRHTVFAQKHTADLGSLLADYVKRHRK